MALQKEENIPEKVSLKGESIFKHISFLHFHPHCHCHCHYCQVTNILGLAPPPPQHQAAPTRGSVLRSVKVFFENFYENLCRERHGTEGSNVSGTSLEHSSSVEVCAQLYKTFGNVKSDFVWQLREHRLSLFQVLSEMEDEAKFDSDINSPFF